MFRLLSICVFLAAASQGHAQSLVGKWDCEGRNGPNRAAKAVMEFRDNGRFQHYLSMGVNNQRGRGGAVALIRGTWKLSGDRLVETAQSVKITRVEQGQRDITNTALGRTMAKGLRDRLLGRTKISRTRIEFLRSGRFRQVSRTISVTCSPR